MQDQAIAREKRVTLIAGEKEKVYALLRKRSKYNRCQLNDIELAAEASTLVNKDIKPTAIAYIRKQLCLKPSRIHQPRTKRTVTETPDSAYSVLAEILNVLKAIATKLHVKIEPVENN